MNPRIRLTSYSLLVCIICGARSSDLESASKVTFPTPLAKDSPTKLPVIEASESRVSNDNRRVYNDLEDSSEEVSGAPPDHIVAHSDHDDPEEPATRAKNSDQPGDWSKKPPKVELDFVPTKLYAQVRNTHTVKHLPREEALKSATNEEERLAALRLREVVSKSKKNTIYTEEGYEDAAYDHAGHLRDADFHEGYAKKLDANHSSQKNVANRKARLKVKEDSSNAEELNDYEDDYRDHAEDSSIVKESQSPEARKSAEREKRKKLKSLWQDSSIDPKEITKNEIEKLEEDLEKEYRESERNTEKEVPENLKKPQEDYEEEENAFSREYDDLKKRHDEVVDDDETEDSGESVNPPLVEIGDASSTSDVTIKDNEVSSEPSVEYGKIFWDYFKALENNQQPKELSTPEEITTTPKKDEEFTSSSLPMTFDPPSTEPGAFPITSRMDDDYPSAVSFYESWKQKDREKPLDNGRKKAEHPAEALVAKSDPEDDPEKTSRSKKNASSILESSIDSTTMPSPKKLSYKVMIRSSPKTTTKSPPSDHKDVKSVERNLIVKSTRNPENSSRNLPIQDFSITNDFTVIQPPPSLPLRQVTFADFPPVSQIGFARPSATHEIKANVEKGNNRYHFANNIHDYQRNRYQPLQGPRRNFRNDFPLRGLVPPSPINTSEYAEYLGLRRAGKPRPRHEEYSSLNPWPGFLWFYRSIGKPIYGRRKRSLNEVKSVTINGNEKVNINIVDRDKKWPERNRIRHADRLVAADNNRTEKSVEYVRRKRRNDEDLLHESPRIVDDVINDEIASRFKDKDPEEDDEEEDDDNDGKVDITVPDFDFAEVIENSKSEKTVKNQSLKVDPLDTDKYPFYIDSKIPRSSALKYITNPRKVPRKTLGGTEFYDSRDKYRDCDDVEPDLSKVLPEDEEPSEDQGPRKDQPRLRDLGDKLDCFRAKYFDDDPLDNPLFMEKRVGQPGVPEELDALKLASRILGPSNDDLESPVIVRRVSRRPEIHDVRESGLKSKPTSGDDNAHRNDYIDTRSVKFQRNSGEKIRRGRRRKLVTTTTETPEIPVTPYQRQVYEDVMGTIKNLADLYQTYKPVSPIEPIANQAIDKPRENVFHHPNDERPRGIPSRELMPPKFNLHRMIPYRTNRVSYRMRTRSENGPGEEGRKVGYFRTVRVHKRSVDDEESLDLEEARTINDEESLDLEEARSVNDEDLDLEESRNIAMIRTRNSTIKTPLNDDKSKDKVMPEASERVIYTIRDRIRHSRPRETSGRYGKFANLDTAETVDVRRQEPRYNGTRRKFVPTTTIPWKDPEEKPEEQVSTRRTLPLRTAAQYHYLDEPGEIYKIQHSTTRGRQIDPEETPNHNPLILKDKKNIESEERDMRRKLRRKNYDVHESLEEDVTTMLPIIIESTGSSEQSELEKYLESDPPGYSDASEEFTTKSSSSQDEGPTRSFETQETRRKSNEDEEEEEDEDAEDRQVEKPSYVDEESSTKSEEKSSQRSEEAEDSTENSQPYVDEESSPRSEETEDSSEQSESYVDEESSPTDEDSSGQPKLYKNAEEDDEDEEEDEEDDEEYSPQVEYTTAQVDSSEKEFDRFVSRPFSPFESYEDPKYKDLGPRVSKPSFHHPSFSTYDNPRKSRYQDDSDSDESEERSDEKSPHIFSWNADENDNEKNAEESKDSDYKIGIYEFPWERRERLARERRRREKKRREHERLYGFPPYSEDDEEDDEDTANSELRRKRVYPWNRRFPSTISQRPKQRFSSRYKTKNKDKDEDDPAVVAEANPRESKISVTKSSDKSSRRMAKNRDAKNDLKNETTESSSPRLLTTSRRIRMKASTIGTTSTTIPSIGNNRRTRIWRTTTSTTMRPINRSRKNGVVEKEPRESESQKNPITINPTQETGLHFTINDSSGTKQKIRRRGSSLNRSTTTTTRPVFRRRLQKTTPSPERNEASTMKSFVDKVTTPKVKTVERHSRFSKKEIITKTSYPGLIDNDNNDDSEEEFEEASLETLKRRKSDEEPKNESIKKVSILTEETPDHIYRTEEIDKNGVKGKFITITANNGTNSSFYGNANPEERSNDHEDAIEMLKRLESSEEKEEDDDPESSFKRDSNLMANLMGQSPPFRHDFSSNENAERESDFFDPEGSGSEEEVDKDEDASRIRIQSDWMKKPEDRLYHSIEEQK